MQAKKRLSLVVAIFLSLQLILPIWSNSDEVSAAPTGPIISSLSPSNNASNVPTTGVFKVIFDEDIKKGDLTKKITIHNYSTNDPVKEYLMNDSKITVLKNVLTIDARALKLDTNVEHYILIEAGAVANSNGALFSGLNLATQWNFRTAATDATDRDNPRLSSNPIGLCATNVVTCTPTIAITGTLQFVFDENVYVSGGNITLSGGGDSRSISVLSNEVQGSGSNIITLAPATPFKPSTTYTITIANKSIVDGSDNPYAGGTWKFTTHASPVQLISQTPSAGEALSGTVNKLELNFDQAVLGSDKKLTIRRVSDNVAVFDKKTTDGSFGYSNGNRTVTVSIGNVITINSSYYVMIESGAFSLSNNASAIYYGIHDATEWVFSTGYGTDTRSPSFTMVPKQGSVTASNKEKIVLTFDENVYVNSGNIEIREFNSGSLYRSIPVTSTRVTGGGSKVITIDPHMAVTANREEVKSFSLGMKYYITFSDAAFIDLAGNRFAKDSRNNYYNFQIATTSAVTPQIQSISPSNGTTTVPFDSNITQFKATFDKSIVVDSYALNSVSFIPVVSSYDTISGTLEYDPKNGKGIIIKPNSDLRKNTEYYINISDNSIADVNGNYFVGIQNEYQWKFRTLGGDTTPPVISKVEVSGNTIRLVYNRLLNEGMKPSAASFYATANDKARNISSITIEGNVVFVKLVSNVLASEKVALSYTKATTGLIQDLSGNQAASFSNINVTNGFTENKPTVKSSNYSGSKVNLSFSETLNSIHSLAYTQFTVTVNGKVSPISDMTQSGSNLSITLNQSIPAKAKIVVSYTAGFYPLSGTANGAVATFSHTVGTTTGSGSGTNTTGAPVIQYITLSGNQLFLQYDEPIKSSTKPGIYQYAVHVNGKATKVTAVTVNSEIIALTVSPKPDSSLPITVTYSGTSSTALDEDYNPAASFNRMSVTEGNDNSNGDTSNVTIQGAVLKGNVLTLNFSGNLDKTSVPTVDQFSVRISNNSRVISSISINGSQVIMKLSISAKVGEVATVSYFGQNDMLQSASGVTVDGFSNMAVANQTTIIDSLSDDFASVPNGVLLKTSASSMNNDVSPGGSRATNYTITTDKLVTAITTLAAAEMKTANIVFEVPTTQNAAIVSYSLAALQAAGKNGDFTLVINYGDLSYSVPISSIDLNKAARQSGGSAVSNYLRIAFEEGSSSATTSLETAINRNGASIIAGPFVYELTVVNGSTSEDAVITGNITRTVQSSANITFSNTTAVYYDEGISAISAVPTTFSKDNGSTTITFKRPGNSAYAIVKSDKTFADTTSHWAHDSITIMARKFVIEGHSTTKFNPQASITRGEFATYIAKGLGLSTNKAGAKKFKDVNSDTVMGGYIGAAVEAGIVSGVSSTSFAPNSYITRQDMALMMIRAASYGGISTTLSSSVDSILNGYSDKSQLSAYAKPGVATAINLGIISGTTTTKLSPKQNATRAEGTIMIMRLLKKIDSLQY